MVRLQLSRVRADGQSAVGRQEEAIRVADELLADIELKRLKTSEVVLKASRLARLVGHTELTKFLGFERNGYPTDGSARAWIGLAGRWAALTWTKGNWKSKAKYAAAGCLTGAGFGPNGPQQDQGKGNQDLAEVPPMSGRPTSSLRARLLRALPVPVAGLVGYCGSMALTDPGTTRVVVMIVLFFATGLITGFVVDAVEDERNH